MGLLNVGLVKKKFILDKTIVIWDQRVKSWALLLGASVVLMFIITLRKKNDYKPRPRKVKKI